jgi:hypothetical protein
VQASLWRTYSIPSPDFIVEALSTSTEKSDRGVKFEDHQSRGVEGCHQLFAPRQLNKLSLRKQGQ